MKEIRTDRSGSPLAWALVAVAAGGLACSGDLAARLEARDRANPIAYGPPSIERGRALYALHCERCHGPRGLGDGPDAAALEGGAGNLAERGAVLRDGSIAYKIEHGQNLMPPFAQELDANQIWDLTNYVKSLSR